MSGVADRYICSGLPQMSDGIRALPPRCDSKVHSCYCIEWAASCVNACRPSSQRSLDALTPRQSPEKLDASSAAERSSAEARSTPLTHPSSSPALSPDEEAEAELEEQQASLRERTLLVGKKAEAAGLTPRWLHTELGKVPEKRRGSLPEPKQKLPSINIFNIVRDWIGEALMLFCYCFCIL